MSYDNEDDEDGDESQEYNCQNEGCVGEETFEAAPAWWFEERDLSTPKNCPGCKEWIDEQKEIGPISAVCAFCGYHWSIEASYRIIYHKTTGNWDEYWAANADEQMCRMCVEFPRRRLELKIRKAERKYSNLNALEEARNSVAEDAKERLSASTALDARPEGKLTKRLDVPVDAVFYQGIPTPPDKIKKHGKNQLTHILKKDHKWGRRFGIEDPGAILSLASRIARSSNEPHIKQYRSRKNSNIIKYDMNQRVVVFIRRDPRSLTGYRIETSYPMEPGAVLGKLKEEWK